MTMTSVMRYTMLAVSVAAMGFGVLVITGVMIPPNFPDQYRVLLGIVIVLYGLYRFVVTYFRNSRS